MFDPSWARSLDTQDYFIATGIALVIALGCFWATFRNLMRARVIEDTPTSKIRSASQGYVELNGQGEPYDDGPIEAPLTGSACLWYSYEIEEYRNSGKNSRWVSVEKGISDTFFQINDGTGTCYIDPHRAEVTPTVNKTWKGSARHPRQMANQSTIGKLLSSGRYRYTEKRIHEGQLLYALGFLETTNPPTAGQRAKQLTKDILNEWKQDREAMLARFDTNNDGEIDMDEWQQARLAAKQEANQRASEDVAQLEPIHVLSRSPEKRRPYLISTKDQRDLAKRYRLHSMLALAGFMVGGVASAYLLIARFTG